MANGRQRKRDVLLAKKEAERQAKLGLAGLNPEALASVVSDDTNDLDNVSYTTTGGATVSVKNDRNKDVTPTTNILGGRKGYTPGGSSGMTFEDELVLSQSPSSRGSRKGYKPGNQSTGPSTRSSRPKFNFDLESQGGPSVRSSRPQQEALFSDGPSSRSSRGFSFDDELQITHSNIS